ncbi:MAG: polysaccharide deacetylase family protein [Deltaproteobacteria bacterium]|nr:polysaccharide deacetylase family protein [Deltaproteobacteria bacterium]
MIDLLARDAASRFGIAAVLETEKIPYRPVATVGDATGPLVVATHDLSEAEIAALDGRAALVLHGGERFARAMLGAAGATDVERAATLPVDAALWPASSVALARELGKETLRLPPAPVCKVSAITRGRVLATLADGAPALAAHGRCLWSAIDLGAAFTNLLTERAVPVRHESAAASPIRVAARRLVEHAYYAAPEAMRRRVQRRWYAALERRLEGLGDAASEYPIDTCGWLLTELVTALVRRVAGGLVRVARWPAPYRAAATLTHDVEPRRFAYTRGLSALLDAAAASGHAATFGLVARSSTRWLDDAAVARLGTHGVLCHGLAHRGENVCGRDDVRRDVETARSELERRLARPVRGYRSPRLDRSPDLLWALDQAGFSFDSSYPDVDRENIAHFGGGVRVNVPYRPPIASDAGALRPSRCLELPLTAPDCIQPLFGGTSIAELRAQVAAKASYLRATGGLYVALVHGGVFGADDQARRTAHLEFVAGELRRPDVWLARAEDVADWWCRREALRVADDATGLRVTNDGTQAISGARVIIEREGGERSIDLPPLAPGATITITSDGPSSAPSLTAPRTRALPAA